MKNQKTETMKERKNNVELNANQNENLTIVFDGENGKKGIKSPDGKILVPANYDDFVYTYDYTILSAHPYVAVRDGKMGLVKPDGKGTEITPFVYYDIHMIKGWVLHFLYRNNSENKFGIMSRNGKEITPCNLESYSCGTHTVFFKSGNHHGLWHSSLDELLEPIYDEIEVDDPDEPLVFTLNGEKGYVKLEDHSFLSQAYLESLDEDESHDLLLECICDQYDF